MSNVVVMIEGELFTVAALAADYNVSVPTMWRRLSKITTRPTFEQLALWGRQWRWGRHKVRMGPSGWEVMYRGTRVWVPYCGIGVPKGLVI